MVLAYQDEPAERPSRAGVASGFDAQVGADLLEGDLHLPALQVCGEDCGQFPVGVGAEQSLEIAAPGQVA